MLKGNPSEHSSRLLKKGRKRGKFVAVVSFCSAHRTIDPRPLNSLIKCRKSRWCVGETTPLSTSGGAPALIASDPMKSVRKMAQILILGHALDGHNEEGVIGQGRLA